jgi:hypothetical protein
MAIQEQDNLDSFFTSSLSKVNLQTTRLLEAGTAVEENAALPVRLFEMNKDLFDRALENGFRLLGAV